VVLDVGTTVVTTMVEAVEVVEGESDLGAVAGRLQATLTKAKRARRRFAIILA
jgi:hypothetical protein